MLLIRTDVHARRDSPEVAEGHTTVIRDKTLIAMKRQLRSHEDPGNPTKRGPVVACDFLRSHPTAHLLQNIQRIVAIVDEVNAAPVGSNG